VYKEEILILYETDLISDGEVRNQIGSDTLRRNDERVAGVEVSREGVGVCVHVSITPVDGYSVPVPDALDSGLDAPHPLFIVVLREFDEGFLVEVLAGNFLAPDDLLVQEVKLHDVLFDLSAFDQGLHELRVSNQGDPACRLFGNGLLNIFGVGPDEGEFPFEPRLRLFQSGDGARVLLAGGSVGGDIGFVNEIWHLLAILDFAPIDDGGLRHRCGQNQAVLTNS